MWDGYVIGQFARRVISMEESGLLTSNPKPTCDDVPESSRFSDVTLGFSEDGSRGRLYLGRFRHENDGAWIVQEIEFDFIEDPSLVQSLDGLSDTLSANHLTSTDLQFETMAATPRRQDVSRVLHDVPVSLPMKSTAINSYPILSAAAAKSIRQARRNPQHHQSPEDWSPLLSAPAHPQRASVTIQFPPLPIEGTLSYTEGISERGRNEAIPYVSERGRSEPVTCAMGDGYPDFFGWGRHSECMSKYSRRSTAPQI